MSKFDLVARPHLSRRSFLHAGRARRRGAHVARRSCNRTIVAPEHVRLHNDLANSVAPDIIEVGIVELQARMAAGTLTARDLVQKYIERIEALDQSGPTLRSVIELRNPDALAIAGVLDAERAALGARGPLHGIPILVKDNVDTADKMLTTAGSLGLVGSGRLAQDATVAARLRAAGAIILGKAKSERMGRTFAASARAADGVVAADSAATRMRLTATRVAPAPARPAAVRCQLARRLAGSLGTETDGSIVCPSSACGVVGIKPTVGLTSRAGVYFDRQQPGHGRAARPKRCRRRRGARRPGRRRLPRRRDERERRQILRRLHAIS